MSTEIDVHEATSFIATREAIRDALQTNWETSEERLFSSDELAPTYYLMPFNADRIGWIVQYENDINGAALVYPASGALSGQRHITRSSREGYLERGIDFVIDITFGAASLDPTQSYTLEDLEFEEQLVLAAARRNSVVVDVVRRHLGCDDRTLMPRLVFENVFISSAPTASASLITARTIWSFTQEVIMQFNGAN